MVFNIDFDGTCVTHSFPEIGNEIGSVPVLRTLVKNGHDLILFTMRCDSQQDTILKNEYKIYPGDFLTEAVSWFEFNNLPLYGIQSNPAQHTWTTSPKSWAHYMIDDSAIGCPLKYIPEISNRTFVDWIKITDFLYNLKVFNTAEKENLTDEIYAFFEETYGIKL